MIRPRLEVAEVFREFTPAFLHRYGDTISPDQRRVLWHVARCRTAELGGHVDECDRCGHRRIAYNSCCNRHCPKCQAAARAQWLDQRSAELLPVEYFHVVFTLPHEIGPLALQNRRRIYGMLFQAAAESLLTIAADPRHLGAQIGFLAVLHTWGQNLHLHPHVHCVVPGGGLSPDRSQWIACRPGFFLPVRVLGRLFRAKFLSFLRDAYDRRHILFHGQQWHLEDPIDFRQLVAALREKEWVIYAKPAFGGSPEIVLKYLARYTHRVAISNYRLIGIEDGKVHFYWKDYADGNRQKTMALDGVEFIRRFLLHVVPSGFMRIRHFGFLAHGHRTEKLELCRRLLNVEPASDMEPADQPAVDRSTTEAALPLDLCPACKAGRMVVIEEFERQRTKAATPATERSPLTTDTS
jgi:putative transposase/transposase-like zinc-binding protein